MKKFEYICLHCTEDGMKINDFTLFADVVSRTEDTVTFQRYQKFGKLKWHRLTTIPADDFDYYYKPITDEQYHICLKMEENL